MNKIEIQKLFDVFEKIKEEGGKEKLYNGHPTSFGFYLLLQALLEEEEIKETKEELLAERSK